MKQGRGGTETLFGAMGCGVVFHKFWSELVLEVGGARRLGRGLVEVASFSVLWRGAVKNLRSR